MVEINNTFLLTGLIIVAVTCIYLLYVSFNRPDMSTFKNNINNMVQQNKKRDEIVNFLLDKVQGLNTIVSKLQEQCQSGSTSGKGGVVQQNVVSGNDSEVKTENLDELMEQLNDGLEVETSINQQLSPENLQMLQEMSERSSDNVNTLSESNVDLTGELDVLEESEFMNVVNSEFETVMDIVQNTTQTTEEPIPDNVVVEDVIIQDRLDNSVDEVVDNVIEELKETKLSKDDVIYLKSLPQKKDELADSYNVKDLRDICKRFNLGTYGRKVEIAERILNVLS